MPSDRDLRISLPILSGRKLNLRLSNLTARPKERHGETDLETDTEGEGKGYHHQEKGETGEDPAT